MQSEANKTEGKARLLLVEDEAIIALQQKNALCDRGYEVIHASSGQKAVELVRRGEGIDLILMDINLGVGIDGTEAARKILAVRDIPIVFLSSHIEEEIVRRTEAVGSYGYVVKDRGITVLDASIKMAFKLFEAHRKLAMSEDRFFKAFDLSPDSININRLSDGVYVNVNSGFRSMTGWSSEEVLGRSSLPGDLGIWARAEDRERLKRGLVERGEVANLEAEFRKKDGSLMIGLMSARIIEVDGERCVLSITRDITSRKLSEKGLENMNRVRAVVGKATQLILRETDSDRLLEGACRIAVEEGRFRMAWIGLVDEAAGIVRPTASAGVVEGYLEAIRISLSDSDPSGRGPTGIAARSGKVSVCADVECDERLAWRGQALARGYRSMASFPLLSGPKVIGVFSVYSGESAYFGEGETSLLEQLALDISFALDSRRSEKLREEAEEKLRESEQLYRESFMQSSAVKLLIEPRTGSIVDANLAAAEFYGYPISKLRRMAVSDLNTSPPDSIRANIQLVEARLRKRFTFKHRLSSGEFRDVEVFTSPIELGGTTLLHSIVHDITEQKRIEGALAASEAKFRTVFELAPVGMALADPAGAIRGANRAFAEMLGRSIDELVSQPYADFTHPEDLEASKAAVDSCLSGEKVSCRLVKRYLHRDGHPVWADVSLSLLRDERGEPLSFIIHMLDIEARMRYEEQLKSLVAQKEILMKELQHRVKNNLNVVSGLLGLEENVTSDESVLRTFANARARIASIAAIYERLYLSEDLASVDLDLYVEDLAAMIFSTYNLDPTRIRLGLQVEKLRLDTKRAVPVGLILNELVSNALKYAYPEGPGGEVRVRLALEGGSLVLMVADDGPGLPADLPPESDGMGMTLVRMLAEQLGAELRVDSARGTSVTISFAL